MASPSTSPAATPPSPSSSSPPLPSQAVAPSLPSPPSTPPPDSGTAPPITSPAVPSAPPPDPPPPPVSNPPSASPPPTSPPSDPPPSSPSPPSAPPPSVPPPSTQPSLSPPIVVKPPSSEPPPPPVSDPPISSSPPPPSSKSLPPPKRSPPPPPHSPSSVPPPESPPSAPPPGPIAPKSSATPSKSPPSESPPSISPPNIKPSPSSSPPPPPTNAKPPTSTITRNTTYGTPNSGTPASGNSLKISPAAVAGIGVVVALSLLFFALAIWCLRRKKSRNINGGYAPYVMSSPLGSSHMSESSYPKSPTAPLIKVSSGNPESPYSPPEGGLGNSKWFSIEELSEITNGFSTQNILGEGGFGYVYKGTLSDGREVAVKQLKAESGQGEREFQAEVEIISRIHHRHLVSLVGYCMAEDQRLLVYEYVPNNTLHYHLHGSRTTVLDWSTRVRVAVGAARGIAYLHEDCHPRIIHRDIKSSNILLDHSFEARVSDFGLAKLTVDAQTHVTTRVMGTFGYLAPEYASSGKLTDRSDVFSFGVVLLELITGRKPVDPSQPMGDESLVEWARPLMNHALETGKFDELPDPRLKGNYSESEMFRMIEASAACVRHSASMRPRMGLVVRALDNLAESVDLHNGVKPGQSELFHSGANSEEIRIFHKMAFGEQPFSSDFSQASWISGTHRDV